MEIEVKNGVICVSNQGLSGTLDLSDYKGVKYVYCHNNKIEKLIIPHGVEYFDCSNNRLIELVYPMEVKQFRYRHNPLYKASSVEMAIECVGSDESDCIIYYRHRVPERLREHKLWSIVTGIFKKLIRIKK